MTDANRRRMVLTDADIEAIADALGERKIECSIDLTMAEGVLLKRLLKRLDNISTWIGRTVVIAIVALFLAMLSKGFWSMLDISKSIPK